MDPDSALLFLCSRLSQWLVKKKTGQVQEMDVLVNWAGQIRVKEES